MLAGSDKLVEKGNQHFASKLLDSTTEGIKDNARIKRKLLKQAKSQGIKVVESPGFSNSAYVGTDAGRLLRRGLASGMKWGRKSGNREITEGLKSVSETLNDQLGGVSGFGKDKPKPQVTPKKPADPSFKLKIEDVYSVYGKGGCSVTGKIASGYIEILDEVMIKETGQIFTVESITTTFRKLTDKAGPGDNVGLCLVGSKKEDFKRGMTVCSPSETKLGL